MRICGCNIKTEIDIYFMYLKCSFFTWFSEGEYKLNLDEIRDEVTITLKA